MARRGRPRKTVVFACDKYPQYAILIPAWEKDEALQGDPWARFIGGRLDVALFREYRNLDDTQTKQLVDTVKKDRMVRVIEDVEVHKCSFCSKEFNHTSDLEQHLQAVHHEALGIPIDEPI